MSVAEIKEALGTLTAAELAEVEKLAADLRQRVSGAEPQVRVAQIADADVPAALDAVFEKHHKLLRRLAQ